MRSGAFVPITERMPESNTAVAGTDRSSKVSMRGRAKPLLMFFLGFLNNDLKIFIS